MSLDASDEERGRARKVILDRLAVAKSWDLARLARGLVSLDASAGERGRARKVILDRLPSVEARDFCIVAEVLVELKPTEEEIETSQKIIVSQFFMDLPWDNRNNGADLETLLPVLRQLSSVTEWLSMLGCGTDNSEYA